MHCKNMLCVLSVIEFDLCSFQPKQNRDLTILVCVEVHVESEIHIQVNVLLQSWNDAWAPGGKSCFYV